MNTTYLRTFTSNEVNPNEGIPAMGRPHIYEMSRRHKQNQLSLITDVIKALSQVPHS